MRRLAALAPVVLVAVACGNGTAAPPGEYVLHEFSIEGASALPAGETRLQVRNEGAFAHTLVVSRRTGEVVASTGVVGPGDVAVLPADLEPGAYQFTCRIVVEVPDGHLVDHFREGMALDVTVKGP